MVSHRNSKTAAAARNSGHTTSACWLTRTARGDFATGHATGDIIVWALPGPDDLQPRVLAQLRVAPAPAQPLRSLQFVSGRHESLLVFGGQGEDQPDGLVLLPLPEPMLVGAWLDGHEARQTRLFFVFVLERGCCHIQA